MSFCASGIKAQNDFSVTIRVPQNSGWAFVNYDVFRIAGNNLYILGNSISREGRKDTLLAVYPIKKAAVERLMLLAGSIDSIGWQTNHCVSSMFGWPRFFIDICENGRMISGTIAAVYRENIFDIVDVFNSVLPKHKIISYHRKALVKAELACKKTL